MLVRIVALLLCLFASRTSAELEDMSDLASQYSSFDFVEEVPKKHHFVMFYTPWSVDIQVDYTWNLLAQALNNLDSLDVTIAKLDCIKDPEVCSEQDITGYPTFKFYKFGEDKPIRFKGTIDVNTLFKFVNEQLQADVSIDSPKQPPVKELTKENFWDTVSEGMAFIKFYAPWCGHCQRLAPTWQELGEKMEHHTDVVIGKVDCTEHRDICTEQKVTGYPTLLWFVKGKKMDKYSGDRSIDHLASYAHRMANLKQLTTDDDELVEEKRAVIELRSHNFKEEIKNGLTFVDFYLPWCGYCKRLAPTWELLGQRFNKDELVKIAKVDCSIPSNEKLCMEQQIDRFPFLNLYIGGKKVSQYEGNRDLEDLTEFINQHLVHDEL